MMNHSKAKKIKDTISDSQQVFKLSPAVYRAACQVAAENGQSLQTWVKEALLEGSGTQKSFPQNLQRGEGSHCKPPVRKKFSQ